MLKNNLGNIKQSILGNLNEESSLVKFISILKESKFLKTELAIFDNIENKYIPNEDLAIKYINENIKLIKNENFTKEDFIIENKKIQTLFENVVKVSNKNDKLYENINTLIYESLNGKKSTNVNKLHDSFTFVLEHLKNNKKEITESTIELPVIPEELKNSDFLIKKAIFEFNQKYSEILSEDEIQVLKSIINENVSKENVFNSIKESTINALENFKSELDSEKMKKSDITEQREIDKYANKINESIQKIKTLNYNKDKYETDVIELIDLKSDLC
jgi:hypothetical protein